MTTKRHDDSDILESAVRELRQRGDSSGPSPEALQRTRQAMRAAVPERPGPRLAERIKHMRKFLKYPIGVAATILIAIGVFLLLPGSERSSVVAQAVEALKQAKTVHAEGFSLRDGKPVKDMEMWYAAGEGVREQSIRPDGTVGSERLDDGKFEWVYQSSQKSVIKSKSTDPVGAVTKIIEFDSRMANMKIERWPAGDRTIENMTCEAYTFDRRSEGNVSKRVALWIDSNKRTHRIERQELQEGKWLVRRWAIVDYDTPVPQGTFLANFQAGVPITDTTGGSPVDLKGNLLSGEVLGLVLTVHQVHRLDNGAMLVVWSMQPSQETLKRFGLSSPSEQAAQSYGRAQVFGSKLLPLEKGSVQSMMIAQWRRDGVQTEWTVLIPRGERSMPVGGVQMSFIVHTGGELQRDLQSKGQPWWKQGVVLGDLSIPKEPVAAEQIYREVYSQSSAAQRASKPGAVNLTGQNRPLSEAEKQEAIQRGDRPESVETMSITPQYPPNRITPDEFIRNIQHNYERLLNSK